MRRPEGAHFHEPLHVIVQLRSKQVDGRASNELRTRCAMMRLVLCALDDYLLMWMRVNVLYIYCSRLKPLT